MEDEFEALKLRVQLEHLVADVAELTGEPTDEVIRIALQERLARLRGPVSKAERTQQLLNMLDTSVWRNGRRFLGDKKTREWEDDMLGYGPEGV